MANGLPSFVVRNLVDVALRRNEHGKKPLKKETGKEMCLVAVPRAEGSRRNQSEDIKALLKLHKRFETEALRNLNNGVVGVENNRSTQAKPVHDRSRTLATETKSKTNTIDEYFKDISSKLAQPSLLALSSDSTLALPGNESPSGQLVVSQGNTQPEALTFPWESCNSVKNPPSTKLVRAHACPSCCHGNVTSFGNVTSCCEGEHDLVMGKFCYSEFEQGLTVIPLTSETFAAYDALPTFVEDDPRYDIGSSRNRSDLWLVPVHDTAKSEDAISVNFERYLDDVTSCPDDDNDVGDDKLRDDDDACALVEYVKPTYQRNVHFSQDLHEVHLYSPVQDHRGRRKRGRRRRTEEGDNSLAKNT